MTLFNNLRKCWSCKGPRKECILLENELDIALRNCREATENHNGDMILYYGNRIHKITKELHSCCKCKNNLYVHPETNTSHDTSRS